MKTGIIISFILQCSYNRGNHQKMLLTQEAAEQKAKYVGS